MQGIIFQCHCIIEQLQVKPNICPESKYNVLWLKSLYSDESLRPTRSSLARLTTLIRDGRRSFEDKELRESRF